MNRHHWQQPSRLTAEDIAMQAAAVRIAQRQRDIAAARERLARFAVCASAVAAPFIFFYSIGSY